jgi:hypothetical protein
VRLAPVLRREQLRDRFPGIVDALHGGHADRVPEGFIADYVALDWLEWNSGALRVTLSGTTLCEQMREQTQMRRA